MNTDLLYMVIVMISLNRETAVSRDAFLHFVSPQHCNMHFLCLFTNLVFAVKVASCAENILLIADMYEISIILRKTLSFACRKVELTQCHNTSFLLLIQIKQLMKS